MALDSIGNWRSLGLVTPNSVDWIAFDFQTQDVQPVYRISFSALVGFQSNSYVLIRPRYFVDSLNNVGKSIRVYPSEDTQIIELKIPEYFIGATNFKLVPEIKKFTKYRKRRGTPVNETKYIVRIEELIRSRVTTPIGGEDEVGQPIFDGIEILPN